MAAARVAIVEDDPELGQYFKTLLSLQGYETALYPTAGRFFDALAGARPQLVILDIELPGMDGREIIRVLRANPETKNVFIIAVSGRYNKTTDIVQGLQMGADEYMRKPANADILLARIQTLLRRGEPAPVHRPQTLQIGDLSVDPLERSVKIAGKDIQLTRLEFDLLVYFIQHPNRVLTRSLILEAVWRGDPTMNTRTVDKHVESLRHKLGASIRIETLVRVGYMMKVEA